MSARNQWLPSFNIVPSYFKTLFKFYHCLKEFMFILIYRYVMIYNPLILFQAPASGRAVAAILLRVRAHRHHATPRESLNLVSSLSLTSILILTTHFDMNFKIRCALSLPLSIVGVSVLLSLTSPSHLTNYGWVLVHRPKVVSRKPHTLKYSVAPPPSWTYTKLEEPPKQSVS